MPGSAAGSSSEGASAGGRGYSGTPLAKKLGIRAEARIALVDAPAHAEDLLAPLPDGVTVLKRPAGHLDVIVYFTTERAKLQRRIGTLGELIRPDGSLWVSWPKRASKVPTDMTEDVVRDAALPLGLVDNKVAAIDETWSGLRLVWRLEHR